MATRFYLPSTGASAVSPAFAAEWEYTSAADRRKTATTKIASAMETTAFTKQSAVTNEDSLSRQYVSDPLSGNQTITGTVKGHIRAAEDVFAANAQPQLVIRVVSNDGTTVRGTLRAATTPGGTREFALTLTNNEFPSTTQNGLTSVSALDGDRIVLEIGARFAESANVLRTANLRLGDASATDLPEDRTTTTDDNPWIELSQTLTFQSGGTTVNGSQASETDTAGVGTPAITKAGSQATTTATAGSGSPIVTIAGSQASTTETANGGTPTSSGGVAGTQASETDSALSGTPRVSLSGSQATTSDTALSGTVVVTVTGGQAAFTSAALAGAVSAHLAGTQAIETDQALAGAVVVAGPSTPDANPLRFTYQEPAGVVFQEPAAVSVIFEER